MREIVSDDFYEYIKQYDIDREHHLVGEVDYHLLSDDKPYDGKMILSKDWINRMTSPIIRLGEDFGKMYYGYMWYRPNKLKPVFAAIGDGGNVIYANPEKNISVGVSGTFKPRIFDRIKFIEKYILPLVSEK